MNEFGSVTEPDVDDPTGAPETDQLSVPPAVPVNVYDCVRVPFASEAHELPGAGAVGADGVTTTFTVAEVTVVLTQPVVVFVTTHAALRVPAAFAVFRVMKLSPAPPPVVDTTVALPENVHAYDGVPPFTRPLTVNVKLPPPQSVPDGGVMVNDGSGEIEIV